MTEKMDRWIMQRYAIFQVGLSTFQVIDTQEQREICVCSDYDETEDAKERAEKIVALLNASGGEGG